MPKQIYVNLPVRDLNRSIEFFSKLGFSFDPEYTDDNATCMIIAENIYAMLLVDKFFTGFTGKDVCDTSRSNEVIVALAFENREEVDSIVKRAKDVGGNIPGEPTDHGWMYQWAFLDPDGHRWEPLFMDENATK